MVVLIIHTDFTAKILDHHGKIIPKFNKRIWPLKVRMAKEKPGTKCNTIPFYGLSRMDASLIRNDGCLWTSIYVALTILFLAVCPAVSSRLLMASVSQNPTPSRMSTEVIVPAANQTWLAGKSLINWHLKGKPSINWFSLIMLGTRGYIPNMLNPSFIFF